MKNRWIISFIPIFLLLSSCTNKDEVITNYPFLNKQDENIVLLFSDDHFISEEGNYYDALLDVNKRFPKKVHSFNIIHSSERDLIRYYKITDYPTLIIIHNGAIIIRVEGSIKTNEILNVLEKEFIKEKQEKD